MKAATELSTLHIQHLKSKKQKKEIVSISLKRSRSRLERDVGSAFRRKSSAYPEDTVGIEIISK